MSPDQAQVQSPQPGQPIREGQLDEDKGQEGKPQGVPQDQGNLIQEGDGIPGGTEDQAPGELPEEEGSDPAQPQDQR
mgnify:CR=1 FL=1